MACNHKFQGHKNGVTCLLCGLRMTPKEYAEYLIPSVPEESERPEEPESTLDAVSEPKAPVEEPKTKPDSAPKSATEKSRANRKKKEDDANG